MIWLSRELVSARDAQNLLLVEAYRDNEIDGAHGQHEFMKSLAQNGRELRELALQPLIESALESMVADMLSRPQDEIRALSAIVKNV